MITRFEAWLRHYRGMRKILSVSAPVALALATLWALGACHATDASAAPKPSTSVEWQCRSLPNPKHVNATNGVAVVKTRPEAVKPLSDSLFCELLTFAPVNGGDAFRCDIITSDRLFVQCLNYDTGNADCVVDLGRRTDDGQPHTYAVRAGVKSATVYVDGARRGNIVYWRGLTRGNAC